MKERLKLRFTVNLFVWLWLTFSKGAKQTDKSEICCSIKTIVRYSPTYSMGSQSPNVSIPTDCCFVGTTEWDIRKNE